MGEEMTSRNQSQSSSRARAWGGVMRVNLKIWSHVNNKDQLVEGSIIKIVGFSDEDSYKRISIKKVLKMELLICDKREGLPIFFH